MCVLCGSSLRCSVGGGYDRPNVIRPEILTLTHPLLVVHSTSEWGLPALPFLPCVLCCFLLVASTH